MAGQYWVMKNHLEIVPSVSTWFKHRTTRYLVVHFFIHRLTHRMSHSDQSASSSQCSWAYRWYLQLYQFACCFAAPPSRPSPPEDRGMDGRQLKRSCAPVLWSPTCHIWCRRSSMLLCHQPHKSGSYSCSCHVVGISPVPCWKGRWLWWCPTTMEGGWCGWSQRGPSHRCWSQGWSNYRPILWCTETWGSTHSRGTWRADDVTLSTALLIRRPHPIISAIRVGWIPLMLVHWLVSTQISPDWSRLIVFLRTFPWLIIGYVCMMCIHASVYLLIYHDLSINLSWSIYLSTGSIYLSTGSICLSTGSIYLSIYPSIHLYIDLSDLSVVLSLLRILSIYLILSDVIWPDLIWSI